MKKISRISFNQLEREFTPLSRSVQQQIIGGTNIMPYCVADAIYMATTELGVSVDYNMVQQTAVEIIMEDYGWNEQMATDWYSVKGLTSSQANELITDVFAENGEMGYGNGKFATIYTIETTTTLANGEKEYEYHAVMFHDGIGDDDYYYDRYNREFSLGENVKVISTVTVNAVSDEYYGGSSY